MRRTGILGFSLKVGLCGAACLLLVTGRGDAKLERSIAIYGRNIDTPFRYVDFTGHIKYVQNITGFTTKGDGVHLHVRFNSASTRRSKFVGYGWELPFFESTFRRYADRLYEMDSPEGWSLIFQRDRRNPNKLYSRGGWEATIDQERVTVTRKDRKYVYLNGRLTGLRSKTYNLSFKYGGDGVLDSIKDDATEVLRVVRGERETVIKMQGNRRITLSLAPRYVARYRRELVSLMEIHLPRYDMKLEYTKDEDGNPQLKTDCERFSWDEGTGFAKRVNDYDYAVEPPPPDVMCSATIRQTSRKYPAVNSYWQNNILTGVEVLEQYGVKKITTRFPSGLLRGRKRRYEMYYGDKLQERNEYFYNEKRSLVKLQGLKDEWNYVYEEDGVTLAAIVRNGKLYKERTPNGRKLAEPYLKEHP